MNINTIKELAYIRDGSVYDGIEIICKVPAPAFMLIMAQVEKEMNIQYPENVPRERINVLEVHGIKLVKLPEGNHGKPEQREQREGEEGGG